MFQKQRLEEVNELIREAQTFASESLGIKYPEPLGITQAKEDVCYELYASPKLKLFFDYSEIEKDLSPNKREVYRTAKSYKRKGYDTLVTTLQAYESDGISLTKKMLKDTNLEVVCATIHEIVHSQLSLDFSMEESIASIIESLGSVSFYEQKEGKSSPNYEKAVIEDNMLRFNDNIITQYYNLLYDVYQEEIPDNEKLKIKKELCKEAESKLTYEHKINNASLTYYMTYSRYANEIREACKYSNSLKDAIELFKSLPDKSLPDSRAWAYSLIQEFISTHKE